MTYPPQQVFILIWFTIFCCSSVLLYIEHKRVSDCKCELWLIAKFLAIKEPIEKPTKWIFFILRWIIKSISWSEKSSNEIISLSKDDFPFKNS